MHVEGRIVRALKLGLAGRRARAAAGVELPRVLSAVRDGLRAGLSLSAALEAAEPGIPAFAGAVERIRAGEPSALVLERAAHEATGDVAMALLVLAVHARNGGDPGRAVEALAGRVRARVEAEREARALTTQARLSAWFLLALTPGFLGLLVLLDPAGTWRTLARGGSGGLVLLGLLMQAGGAAWIGALVRAPLRDDSSRGVLAIPGLRVLAVVASLGQRGAGGTDASYACDLVAFLLEAGLSPARALEVAAPVVPGQSGEMLRRASAAVRAGSGRAIALQLAAQDARPDTRRLAAALATADRLGVPLAATLRRLADDLASARRAAVAEAVRAASLKVLVPLGLLVLPAFVLSCLVPLFLDGIRGIRL